MFINEVFTFYSLFSQGSTFMVNISQKIGKIISLNQKMLFRSLVIEKSSLVNNFDNSNRKT